MKPILIDTDCGIDDAVAIMMALASHEVDVRGVTTLAGNVDLPDVMNNVTRLLSWFGRDDIPVYRGASTALVEKPLRARGIHGKNGFGDIELPPSGITPRAEDAPQGMYRIARENPGLTFVTLGPLTNLAMAINLHPDLVDLVSETVVMGGAIDRGNVTKFAEFNFAADPESVQFVLDSRIPLSIVPWDACLALFFSEEDLMSLEIGGTKGGRLFMDLQKVPLAYVKAVYGRRATALADAVAMAYALKPDCARKVLAGNLRMELGQNMMRGASVPVEGQRLSIVGEVDRHEFAGLLRRIGRLP